MSDDDKEYIKHLEDALQRAQTRLESDLMGMAVISKTTTPARNGSLDSDIIEGSIVVGGVIFAKIKKEKSGWAGYLLDWSDKRNAYTHQRYVIGKKTFDEVVKHCIKMMSLDSGISAMLGYPEHRSR